MMTTDQIKHLRDLASKATPSMFDARHAADLLNGCLHDHERFAIADELESWAAYLAACSPEQIMALCDLALRSTALDELTQLTEEMGGYDDE